MGAVSSPSSGGRGKKGKKKSKRHGFSLDMTPMVDVAFLLLTFFMLTTTFSQPQTMQISMPAKDKKTEIAEENLLLFNILSGDSLMWYRGSSLPEYLPLYTISEGKMLINSAIEDVVKTQRQEVINEISEDNMAVVLVFDKKAKYRNMVDMIDELNLMDMKRFSLLSLKPEEKEKLLSFKEEQEQQEEK